MEPLPLYTEERGESSWDRVQVLKQLKCLGSVASLEVKGETDFLLAATPPLKLLFLVISTPKCQL